MTIQDFILKRLGAALLLSMAAMLLLTACSDDPEPPVPATDRTVLVYMVATNDLGSIDLDKDDLAEMQEAARNGHFGNSRLLVYHAPYSGDIQLKEVKADGTISVIKTYSSSVASVSKERMKEVIADMKTAAPAGDYGMVLWSHANGWLVDGIEKPAGKSGAHYSYGVDRGRSMNVASLREAVDGAGISFIYFDCCYMGGVEVVYEMRGAIDEAVVSAAEVALPGMPYHLSLRYLMSPKADLAKAAEATYNYYEGQASLYDRSCTVAVVDLSALDELARATRRIYAAAPAPVPGDYEKKPYSPNKTLYFDLADYVDALSASDPENSRLWHEAYDKAVVYKAATRYFQGIVDLSHFNGLSTYIFDDASGSSLRGYDTTAWYADVASALVK